MRRKTNSDSPLLGLRNNAQEVQVIVPNGSTQPVLGLRHPNDQDLRAKAATHFGGPRQAPRQTQQAAIELPVSTRTQTALLNRLPPATRQVLNGGSGEQSASRQAEDGGTEHLRDPD